ncbi:hypothetical protein B0H10DRAFT_616824 [Mycena sp. CBHHK59/15]|nr:hypothetical protein B0H10DRAFT_616824 [Mycena sp. CBHHK59/15]
MIRILNAAGQITPLAALLNLLACLSRSLPLFSSTLLGQIEEESGHSEIIVILCAIIRNHLEPTKQIPHAPVLGNETVGLVEGLCWVSKDELVPRLATFCNSIDVWMILLDASQPSCLLDRSTRLLVFLATHSKLSRDLLSGSELSPSLPEAKAKELPRLPHIERLCSYLIDTSRKDPEFVNMKTNILTFFGILSVAHADVHTMLVGAPTLIPSLVALSTQVTTLLWEGDEFFMTPHEKIASSIRTLNQTLFLLHHLVFGLEPNFNLRHKLHYAPHRTFTGIAHMFIVTFGRLSCADPPEWIDLTHKQELEGMSEMAQDLLELVVDGPEGDSIWAAYQADHGNDSDTDEEDMETKLLG